MFLDDLKLKKAINPQAAADVYDSTATRAIRDKAHRTIEGWAREAMTTNRLGTITLEKKANPDADKEVTYSIALLNQIDRDQNRYTLTGEQVDAFVELAAARWMLQEAIEVLEPFLKRENVWKAARQAYGLVTKTAFGIKDRYSAKQMIQVTNILHDVNISIYQSKKDDPGDNMTVSREAVHRIAQQAMSACAMSCNKTRAQSKNCPLRHALCTIPGLKSSAEMNPFQDDKHCLFYNWEPEV